MIAGFFEWPVMAILGALTGLLARVAFEKGFLHLPAAETGALDHEMAIPLLLQTTLPRGLLGLVFAAYLSAVLSTADSCLMAASGNLYSDLLPPTDAAKNRNQGEARLLNPKSMTLFLGIVAFVIACQFKSVLDLMLYAYGLMISGLFVPTVAGFFDKRRSEAAAILSMVVGAIVYLLAPCVDTGGWDANLFGILAALATYVAVRQMSGVPTNPKMHSGHSHS